MNAWTQKWKECAKNKRFLPSLGIGFLFFVAAFVLNYFAGIYATDRASAPVTDLILSNIPVFNVDGLFIYGPMIFWLVIIVYAFSEPKKIPFTLKSIALFLVTRSFFISLTHIGPFPTHLQLGTNVIGLFTAGADFFFSGHTGLPFLMALVFWDQKNLRLFSIACSLIFGAVVLMAHLHYSIDVFGAFFITYTIFHLAEKFFREDREAFFGGSPAGA